MRLPFAASPHTLAALRVTLIYAVFATVWIVTSDRILEFLVTDAGLLSELQTAKGAAFVVVTAGLLFILIYRELRRRSESEAALREREERYRFLLEEAADGISIADAQGKYLEVNSKACDLLGYTRAELLQLDMRDLIVPEDLTLNPLHVDEMRSGGTVVTRRRLRRKDGSLVWTETSAKMIED